MNISRIPRALALVIGLTALGATVAFAENVPLDPAGPIGDLTVIESVAPLGPSLTYLSGGNGLIGIADSFPVAGTPAAAASRCDHTWLQYDPPIIWRAPVPLSLVFAVPGVDHTGEGEVPGEMLEFLIWGSNDQISWEQGRIRAVYRDGFDTANTTIGHSDDYTSLWAFVNGPYSFFRATSGDLVENFSSPGEGEIDCLAVADFEAPSVACRETNNPSGKNIPNSGPNAGKSGQNPDGFYELLARDAIHPSPSIFVVDKGADGDFSTAADNTTFGPFPSGTKIKYVEANGATPSQEPGTGDIDWKIKGKGDFGVYAVDALGNVSAHVQCHVPPPPK